jgi:hypothetical protein
MGLAGKNRQNAGKGDGMREVYTGVFRLRRSIFALGVVIAIRIHDRSKKMGNKIISYSIMGLATVMILAWTSHDLYADTGEVRTYLDVEYGVWKKDTDTMHYVLLPFVREESRFRSEGLVYQKFFAGFRFKILSWLEFQNYYARKELMYPGSPHVGKNMASWDAIFHPTVGPFHLLNREANEWNITDKFYRYRNLSEVMYTTPVAWFSVFAFDEFRVDSDQGRVNKNDAGAGVQFDPTKSLSLRIFYDFEANRRNLPGWRYVNFAGLSCAVHL